MEDGQKILKLVMLMVGAVVLAVLMISLFSLIREVIFGSNYEVDGPSQQKIDVNNYGFSGSKLKLIGFERVRENFKNINVYAEMMGVLQRFMEETYPKAEKLSYLKDTLKKEDGEYRFEGILNGGDKFKIRAREPPGRKFILKIADKNNEIFDYDSSKIAVKEMANSLGRRYLPHKIKSEIGEIVVNQDSEGRYEILVSACENPRENARIRQRSLEKVNGWLMEMGFEPKDFNFEIPSNCDAGHEHSEDHEHHHDFE
ncbi:MAG: hypothetical protein Q4A30_01295 [Candidatus Saccharibacteria bacterium]|nr:hypothetical protein [Candidatus Saccharibacteria bacterium]